MRACGVHGMSLASRLGKASKVRNVSARYRAKLKSKATKRYNTIMVR